MVVKIFTINNIIQCSATKQQPQCFHDLNYDDYRSNIDTTFNYMEDVKEFFITEDK